jgi:hypothetical protein
MVISPRGCGTMNKWSFFTREEWKKVHIVKLNHGIVSVSGLTTLTFLISYCGKSSTGDDTLWVDWVGIHNYEICKNCIRVERLYEDE